MTSSTTDSAGLAERTRGQVRTLTDAERRALAALKFDLAPTPDDVWRPSPFNVADLHREARIPAIYFLRERVNELG